MNSQERVAVLVRAKNRGFALIATISVMVLLVMVAIAMLSLSTIEIRSQNKNTAMAEARANARMALMLAIGELQKELGPDQRINANASLKMANSTPTDTSRWVGVWDSWADDQANRPSPTFRRWLVAGDEALVSNSDTAINPGSGSPFKGRYMSRVNPSPNAYDYQSFDQSTFLSHPLEVVVEEVNSLLDIPKLGIDGANAFFGASYGAAQGSRHVVTNHIPRIPPMSIGALQHAQANGKKYTNFGGWGQAPTSGQKFDTVLLPFVNHAIGNSFAVPSIAPTSTEGTFNLRTAA